MAERDLRMRTRVCKRCGHPFFAASSQRYCDACRAAVKRDSVLRDRVCRVCGCTFAGYPRSFYCSDCAAQRKREADRSYKKRGAVRKIGSTDLCVHCGNPYTVSNARQRYCPDCASSEVRKTVNAHKRAYMADHPEENAARKSSLNKDSAVCVICGRTFTANTTTTVCSDSCRAERRRRWQAEADAKRSTRQKKGEKP